MQFDQANRREFIILLGGAGAGWPLAARAQASKMPRVGILSPAASETAGTLSAFREKIRDLGYVEGETIALDFRLWQLFGMKRSGRFNSAQPK